jgi:hypothetical protein
MKGLNTMTINEIIAAIRVWQKANDEYIAACDEPIEVDGFKGYKTTPRRRDALQALRKPTLMLDSELCLNDDHEYETECEAYTIPELRAQLEMNEALLARKEQE